MITIIFPNADGSVAILNAAPEIGLSPDELAAKDVPDGKPWRILTLTDAPDAPPDQWRWTDAGPLGVAPPAPPPAPALTPAQWSYFLDLTGFRAIVDGVLDSMPKTTLAERAVWAALKADVYASRAYRKEVFLELVGRVRAMGVPGIPTDAEIEEAWPLAEAYEGAQALIVGRAE